MQLIDHNSKRVNATGSLEAWLVGIRLHGWGIIVTIPTNCEFELSKAEIFDDTFTWYELSLYNRVSHAGMLLLVFSNTVEGATLTYSNPYIVRISGVLS